MGIPNGISSNERYYLPFVFLGYLIQNDYFQLHTFALNFIILSNTWLIVPCVNIPHSYYLFIVNRHRAKNGLTPLELLEMRSHRLPSNMAGYCQGS